MVNVAVRPGMETLTVNPRTRETERQVDLTEFEVSLVHTVRSRQQGLCREEGGWGGGGSSGRKGFNE